MATRTQIYNQNVEIDTSFINADVENDPLYLPITYSAFEYIEIVDTLNNPGLSGTAVLDNFNDSINSSPLFDFAGLYNNIFNFRITQNIETDIPIEFGASFMLNNIYTVPHNELANKLCIQFDDIFFSTLANKTINDASQVPRYKTGLTSDIMRNIIEDYNQTTTSLIDAWTDSTNLVDLQLSPSMSIKDIFYKAYHNNYVTTSGSQDDTVFNLIMECTNQKSFFSRTNCKYSLEPINKRFIDLYSKLQGQSTLFLQDTVMEGIMESGAQPEDTKTGIIRGFSEADEIQIIRSDPTLIRDMYRNVVVESINESGVSSTAILPLMNTLANFYRLFCNNTNYRLDLPIDERLLEASANGLDAIKISAYYPELEPGGTQAKMYNMLLLNSKMITFKVKGQAYRRPGFFIYFQPRRQEGTTVEGDKHYRSLVGFWYVVQVRHILEGNTYDNIITCVNPFIRNN
jgi:hypothetical protein